MPFDIGTLGMQAASAGIGGILGLALEHHNDQRQLDQQTKLQNLQIAGQKEMGQFNLEQQLKLWEATNYEAQAKQLEKAGLNRALLYGMKGGGGATAAATPGSVSSGEAPKGGGETLATTGMGMQLGLMQAQIELTKAQAKKTEIEANKTAGVDTTKTQTEIESLSQGITNQKLQAELAKVQTRLANMEASVKGATLNDTIDRIGWESLKALEELEMINRNNYINKATQNAQIDIVIKTAIGTGLENALTQAQTMVSKEQAQNLEAERRNIKNKIAQWAADNYLNLLGMSNEQRRTAIQDELKDQKLETQGIEIITQAVDGIFRRIADKAPSRSPIGFR